MSQIERSNQRGKFSTAEIRAEIAASKKYWNSPEGIAEKRKQDTAARSRKSIPPRFPAMSGTRPELAAWETKYRLLKNQ
jgi:hypothetical protein